MRLLSRKRKNHVACSLNLSLVPEPVNSYSAYMIVFDSRLLESRVPRTILASQLATYTELHSPEIRMANDFLAFLKSHSDAFQRSCKIGHVTGSAFIVDPTMTRTLLVHHRKLDKWLQPGGHCDSGETALEAALREAAEETGICASALSPDCLFDIDIHQIPARADSPAHLHYDARYIFVAEPGITATSHESHAVEWVSFEEARCRNPERSIARMIAKAKALLAAAS